MGDLFDTWKWADYVGLAGGAIISVILLPQIWKAYKTKSTGDLSWTMLGTYFVGLVMIGIYGFAERLWPICFSWIVEMALLVIQAIMKFVFDRRTAERLRLQKSESAKALKACNVSSCYDLQANEDHNPTLRNITAQTVLKFFQYLFQQLWGESSLPNPQPCQDVMSEIEIVVDGDKNGQDPSAGRTGGNTFWQRLMLKRQKASDGPSPQQVGGTADASS